MKELALWEHDYLLDMYNIDWLELDEIMSEWNTKRKSVRTVADVAIDTDYLIWDNLNREKIYDLKCCICLGLLRTPSVSCSACNNNYCKICIDAVKAAFIAQ